MKNSLDPPAELIRRSMAALRAQGALGEEATWTNLSGGISNWVVRIDDVVVKAALPQLRVAEEWNADPMRAIHEAHALEAIAKRLTAGDVPEVVFVDETIHAFGMRAAPAGTVNWKEELLAGRVDLAVARRTGDLLGRMHRATWDDAALARRFADVHLFEELRLDPYHARAAEIARERGDAALADALLRGRAKMLRDRHTLVHGDFSPKNVLVFEGRPMLIDFEVVHFGNPDFDTGFMLTHLVMKALHRPAEASAYARAAEELFDAYVAQTRDVRNEDATIAGALDQGGCLLVARIDGKSKVEYLSAEGRERCRSLGRAALLGEFATLAALFEAAR